jgi:hypothetical protein
MQRGKILSLVSAELLRAATAARGRVYTCLRRRNTGLARLWRQSFAAQSVVAVHLFISGELDFGQFAAELSMPVLECSCGMVMSTTARDSRQRCMRCGSITLRELNSGTLFLPALRHFVDWPATEVAVQPVTRSHQTWTRELISEGSHI